MGIFNRPVWRTRASSLSGVWGRIPDLKMLGELSLFVLDFKQRVLDLHDDGIASQPPEFRAVAPSTLSQNSRLQVRLERFHVLHSHERDQDPLGPSAACRRSGPRLRLGGDRVDGLAARFQPELGGPWFALFGWPFYAPPAFFWWWFAYDAYAPEIFVEGAYIAASGSIAAIIVAVAMSVWRAREAKSVTTYGSARWAESREIRHAGLFHVEGVAIGAVRRHQSIWRGVRRHVSRFAAMGRPGVLIPRRRQFRRSHGDPRRWDPGRGATGGRPASALPLAARDARFRRRRTASRR